ncbi:Uncharacterized protein pbN1_19830 [Aromatoleum bremense]|nr:Uncharacterized protein pbN1_19830 [Aromatoleum bremense]
MSVVLRWPTPMISTRQRTPTARRWSSSARMRTMRSVWLTATSRVGLRDRSDSYGILR